MLYDSMNYIVYIEYNKHLEKTVVMPMFAYYTTQTKEIHREEWSWVRNNSFMEMDNAMKIYACDYLTEDNVRMFEGLMRISDQYSTLYSK